MVTNNPSFLLPPGPSVTLESDHTKERELPKWVLDEVQSATIWECYRMHLGGENAPFLARHFAVHVTTIYDWIRKAKAEVPFVLVQTANELIGRREAMTLLFQRVMRAIAESPDIPPMTKVDLMTQGMKACDPYFTAQEEILGHRKGKGRINIEQTGDNAQAVIFDLDTWLTERNARNGRNGA